MVVKTCFLNEDGECFHVVCMSGFNDDYCTEEDFDFLHNQGYVRHVIPYIEDMCEQLEKRGKKLKLTNRGDFIDYLDAWKEVLEVSNKNPESIIQMV